MTKLLVVDELAVLRQHLLELARSTLVPVPEFAEATTGVQALKQYRSFKPEAVVIDVTLPEMNGLKVARQIWSHNSSVKILFWCRYYKESHLSELERIAPEAAVYGYVLKTEDDERLTHAFISLIKHESSYVSPAVRGMRLANKDNLLSDVEQETLQDIALGLTDKAIASRRHISVRGVQNRLSMLSAKFFKGEDLFLKENAGMEIYNPRTRIVLEALKRGLIDIDQIAQLDLELNEWLSEEFDYERS